jgi:outer membrane protein insertion porin family
MTARNYLVHCLVGSWIFALPAADLSLPREYEGRPIEQIRFEPSVQPISRNDLDKLVSFQPGAPLKLADIRDAIKRLYATGEYQDVEVSWEPSGKGVALVFHTSEQWFVGPVEVRGKTSVPPNEGQLANATRLALGEPFTDEDLTAATRGITNLMRRNGFYQGTVEPKIDRDLEHQLLSFTFQVQSGKRARLEMPEVVGDTKIPKEDAAKAAKYKGWFFWKKATADNTQGGIRNVRDKYSKEERLTASVTMEKAEYNADTNRVKPTIHVEGGPKVEVKTEGAKVSKGNLKRYVPVFDEETVNRDLLVQGAANLRDYFQNRGFFDVQVDFETKQVSPDQETITYVLALGEKHRVVKLTIDGNRYFTTDAIRERMFVHEKGLISLRHGRYSDGFVRRDRRAIEALYKDNGFRDVKVTIAAEDSDTSKGGTKKGDVAVAVHIEEGPQYRIAKVDVNGITRKDRDEIMSRLSLSPGQPFSETGVATDRDAILEVYQSSGYPEATFDWRLNSLPSQREVQITYNIVEGQPRFVRDVLVLGLRETRKRLVDPNVLLKPGDPLSWTRMGEMQRRLYDLGVFDKVDMAIRNPQGDTDNKYVMYHLTEGHRYYVGLGFGGEVARIGGSQTDVGQAGGATGFSPRASLEVSRLNLWGLGHSLNFKSRYSTLNRRASLNYLAPRYRNVEGRNISVTALYDNTRDVRTFTAKRYEGSVQLSQRFSKATTALWRYTWRDTAVDPNTLKINPGLIPLLSQPSRIGMISGSVIQDRRDDPTDAHRGIYNTGDLGLVYHAFGGNRNFLRFLGRNSYYRTLKGNLVLASNTEFGVIKPFSIASTVTDPANYIPLPERFFGGGSSSHRGFPDNQAGPRDVLTGFPVGGNALLFHSTELRFPLVGDNIRGVLFHDMGNIYSGLGSISFRYRQRDLNDFNYMVHAVGFGIRYRTPVGPVRVDLAYSLNPPSFNGLKGSYADLINNTAVPAVQKVSKFQFFISIGQAF